MPNWCENNLIIRGSRKELDKFKKDMGEKLLDARKIIPYPEKYDKLDIISRKWYKKADEYARKVGNDAREWYCGDKLTKKQREDFYKENGKEKKDGFNSGGYEWCYENWGTKWGFCDVVIRYENEDEIYYTFETAWSPPLPLIDEMSAIYPKLEIVLNYVEEGEQFSGGVKYISE